MDDFRGLRILLVIVVWATIGGGALIATLWVALGGGRAIGPDDIDDRRVDPARPERRVTSFSTAHIGLHAILGLLTAALITYAALRSTDRDAGYAAGFVALLVTALPGALLFRLWRDRSHRGRPDAPPRDVAATRVEDRLPAPVVYLHGLAAIATAALLVALFLID